MHVAVTGASSGIGEAIAREMASRGAKVSLVARRAELLETLAGELGTETSIHAKDLMDLERCTEWIGEAEAKLGPIDVLVNNAGMQIVAPVEETEPAYGERCIILNLMAPLRMIHAVLPAMLGRRGGTIVNIASLAAITPTPGMTYYNASKGGFAAASEAMRGELLQTGVTVVTVYPGPVKTAMADKAVETYGEVPSALPVGTTEGLARVVRRAITSKRARVVYPRSYHVARWFPGTSRWVTDRMTPRLPRKAEG